MSRLKALPSDEWCGADWPAGRGLAAGVARRGLLGEETPEQEPGGRPGRPWAGQECRADWVERKAPSCGGEPGALSLGSTDLIYETAGGLSEGAGQARYQMP